MNLVKDLKECCRVKILNSSMIMIRNVRRWWQGNQSCRLK